MLPIPIDLWYRFALYLDLRSLGRIASTAKALQSFSSIKSLVSQCFYNTYGYEIQSLEDAKRHLQKLKRIKTQGYFKLKNKKRKLVTYSYGKWVTNDMGFVIWGHPKGVPKPIFLVRSELLGVDFYQQNGHKIVWVDASLQVHTYNFLRSIERIGVTFTVRPERIEYKFNRLLVCFSKGHVQLHHIKSNQIIAEFQDVAQVIKVGSCFLLRYLNSDVVNFHSFLKGCLIKQVQYRKIDILQPFLNRLVINSSYGIYHSISDRDQLEVKNWETKSVKTIKESKGIPSNCVLLGKHLYIFYILPYLLAIWDLDKHQKVVSKSINDSFKIAGIDHNVVAFSSIEGESVEVTFWDNHSLSVISTKKIKGISPVKFCDGLLLKIGHKGYKAYCYEDDMV